MINDDDYQALKGLTLGLPPPDATPAPATNTPAGHPSDEDFQNLKKSAFQGTVSAGVDTVTGQPISSAGPTPPDNRGVVGTINDVGRMLTMPAGIIFDPLNAAVRTVTGTGVPKGTFKTNLIQQQQEDQRVANQYPTLATPLGVLGGTAMTYAAAPEEAAAGAVERGLPFIEKSLSSAGFGMGVGGIGGASTATDYTNTEDVFKRGLQGLETGGVLGLVAPAVSYQIGKGVTAGLNAARGGVPGVSSAAAKPIMEGMTSAGPDLVSNRMDALGPSGALLDSSDILKAQAQGLATKDMPSRNIITEALTPRDQETVQRLNQDIQTAIGPPETAQSATDQAKALRSQEHQNLLPALQAAPPITGTQAILDDVNQRLTNSVGVEKAALTKIKGMLEDQPAQAATSAKRVLVPGTKGVMQTIPGNDPVPATAVSNPEKLQNIKMDIDNMINYGDEGLGITRGAISRTQGAISDIRGSINDTLRQQVPGYAPIMDASSALARKADAIDEGYNDILSKGKTATMASDLQTRLAQANANNQPEIAEGLRTGARAAIYRDLANNPNDLATLKSQLQLDKGQGASGPPSNNQSKLNMLFGPDATNQLIDTLDRNQTFKTSYNDILRGSPTAPRQGAAAQTGPAVSKLIEPNTTGFGFGATLGRRFLEKLGEPLFPDPNASFGEQARVLSAQGQQGQAYKSALIDALRRRNQNASFGGQAGDVGALASALFLGRGVNNYLNQGQ